MRPPETGALLPHHCRTGDPADKARLPPVRCQHARLVRHHGRAHSRQELPLVQKVVAFRRKDRDYAWSLRVNGEVIADSGEGYRRSSYAIKNAEELFPSVALVIDES
jgi:uncharacterized protein YegP (UPF0339 family)